MSYSNNFRPAHEAGNSPPASRPRLKPRPRRVWDRSPYANDRTTPVNRPGGQNSRADGLKTRSPRTASAKSTEADEILQALGLLAAPGQCVSLWIKNAKDKIKARTPNRTGYFTDSKALVREALRHSGTASGCYVTVNPVDSEVIDTQVLQRASNRLSLYGPPKEESILRRRWLFIDIDPERPKDTCATDAEKKLARSRAEEVRESLREKGWPEPLMIDSGNGFYLLYRIDLPTDGDPLIHNVLKALAARFPGGQVTIDTAVAPAKQLMRLPGTMNCKGTDTADRPHRLSKVLEVPSTITAVPRELLEALAAEIKSDATATTTKVESELDENEVRRSLDTLPPAVQGQSGSLAALRAARRIVVGYDVPWDSPQAWELLKHFNARCVPPWHLQDPVEREDLRRKLREAHEYAEVRHQTRGYLRRQDQCRHYEPLAGPFFPIAIPDWFWMGYDTPAIVLDNPPMPYAYGLRLLGAWQWDRPDVPVPDALVKLTHWGAKPPKHWRKQYRKAILEAKKKHKSLKGVKKCSEYCLLHGSGIRHSHYRVDAASCGCFDDFSDGLGNYTFAGKQWVNYQQTGKVYWGYWPALVFGTSKPVGLTTQQVRLFMAITRELTRLAPRPTGKRKPNGKPIYKRPYSDRPDRALVMHSNLVHDSSKDGGMIPCPLLPEGDHVGFNGNLRKYRGRGYSLLTWARRAGYLGDTTNPKVLTPEIAKVILADLTKLAEMFALTIVGRHHLTRKWYTLDEACEMVNTRSGRVRLGDCTLRIYAPSDFLTLWRYTFAKRLGFRWIGGGAECPFVLEESIRGTVNNEDELLAWLKSHNVTRTEFSKRAGMNRRTLYRALAKRIRNTPKFWAKVNRAIAEWDT